MTRHADIDNDIPSWYIEGINQGGKNGKENIHREHDGNITATKDGNTVRLVPLADYLVYLDTPAVTAIIRDGATKHYELTA